MSAHGLPAGPGTPVPGPLLLLVRPASGDRRTAATCGAIKCWKARRLQRVITLAVRWFCTLVWRGIFLPKKNVGGRGWSTSSPTRQTPGSPSARDRNTTHVITLRGLQASRNDSQPITGAVGTHRAAALQHLQHCSATCPAMAQDQDADAGELTRSRRHRFAHRPPGLHRQQPGHDRLCRTAKQTRTSRSTRSRFTLPGVNPAGTTTSNPATTASRTSTSAASARTTNLVLIDGRRAMVSASTTRRSTGTIHRR